MKEEYQKNANDNMLNDLYHVGISKMIGYLPSYTITHISHRDLAEVEKRLTDRGVYVLNYGFGECHIEDGALYAADINQLQEFLLKPDQKRILNEAGWPLESKLFLQRVANEWAAQDSPLGQLIAMAFNSPLLTPEQRAYAYPEQSSIKQNNPIEEKYTFDPRKTLDIRQKRYAEKSSAPQHKLK